MAKKIVKTNLVVALFVVVAVLAYGLIGQAGNLEPPAGPAPTMKTLDEIEPGTPISLVPYTIVEPGSYYLSANAPTTNSMFSGITIYADNVTLDLKGFSVTGDGTAGLHGVFIEGDYKNITIRNGTITNWGGNGIEGATATKCRVEDVQVIDNAGSGIRLGGQKHLVKNNIVSGNGTSAANVVYGIYVENGSIVMDNIASDNGASASNIVFGIAVGGGSTISGNTAYHNGYDATGAIVYGFYIAGGSTVTGNTANDNGDYSDGAVHGIGLGGNSLVDQNAAYSNGTGAGGAVENMDLGVTGCAYGINVP